MYFETKTIAGKQVPRCQAVVWRRDTYRRTGRTRSGFEMHYDKGQCEHRAVEGAYCRKHAKSAS